MRDVVERPRFVANCVGGVVHDLDGHALFARRAAVDVHALVITAGGGACFADLPHRRRDQLLFFSGGLLAQLLVFSITLAVLAFSGSPTSRIGGSFVLVFTVVNAIMFFGNLIPYQTNDGALIARALGLAKGKR